MPPTLGGGATGGGEAEQTGPSEAPRFTGEGESVFELERECVRVSERVSERVRPVQESIFDSNFVLAQIPESSSAAASLAPPSYSTLSIQVSDVSAPSHSTLSVRHSDRNSPSVSTFSTQTSDVSAPSVSTLSAPVSIPAPSFSTLSVGSSDLSSPSFSTVSDGNFHVGSPSDSSSSIPESPISYPILSVPSVGQPSRVYSERHQRRLANEFPEDRLARLDRDYEARAPLRARQARQPNCHRLDLSRPSDLNLAGFSYYPDLDYSASPLIAIGNMNFVCEYCNAKRLRGEAKGICCNSGQVRLEPIAEPPEPYLSLFSGDYPDSNHFLKMIRRYNGCFQMTSFGTTGAARQTGFESTFRIQGQIYHKMGSLLPVPDAEPKFVQIYFMGDADTQVDRRCNLFVGLRRNIVANFQALFDQHNNLVRTFRTALDSMPTDQHRIILRADMTPAGEHERRFNAPTVDEVAIVMVDNALCRRDIIIRRRDQQLQRICETHKSYDALQYPIIFWRGDCTYHFGLPMFNPRVGRTNSTLSSNVVNCSINLYAKIETERLLFVRREQDKLRVEQYIHLRDAVAIDGRAAGRDSGRPIILPSTHVGSPRHMHEYAQDAMAYVRLYGRPDLFITLTCNPSWVEIQTLLLQGQSAIDRHDLTSRVFRQKLIKLIDVVKKHKLFGPTKCFVYTIEWQKRGLPHAHILFWLENRIRPEQIDDVISAELPDISQDPRLHEIVLKHMVHGPCGPMNRNSPCMKEGKCTKNYPRTFICETRSGIDGYPLYRRRSPADGGHFSAIERSGLRIDNSWIVPHCPTLSRMFNAHINVEYCNSVKSIKYICKYITKGSDGAVVGVESSLRNDEVTQYQLGRYISTSEAFWKIFDFPIHARYPAVLHLHIHLENGQRVCYNPDDPEAAIARGPPKTTLTAFFSLCQTDPFARTLLYADLPKFYTWNSTTKAFSRRLRGRAVDGFVGAIKSDTIGRIYTVHPSVGECFFLRLLLNHVRGPTSFEDLRRFDGQVCMTFRQACQLRGLLESDSHWEDALREAAATRMPYQLRSLFATIVSFCSPSDPTSLWELFKSDLSEDILYRLRQENPTLSLDFSDSIFNQALILIEDTCLTMNGKLLTQLGLPAPVRAHADLNNSEILRETNYDAEEMDRLVSANLPILVADQRSAFDTIVGAIRAGKGGFFFLDAPGGTGKTFLLNLILAYIRQMGDIVVAAASSGIAATLLSGGRTAHSAFKLPFDVTRTESPMCDISRASAKGRMLQQCKAIIWDECTMAHKLSLEALDRTLKDLRRSVSLFGGVVVILAGDFRQTLPVIPRSTPADELSACLKQSHLWRNVQTLRLSTNMRVHNRGEAGALTFSNQLLSIGEGSFPSDPMTSMIRLPDDFCQLVSSVDELIEKVFPDLQRNLPNREWLSERAILAPTNESVNELNLSIQEKLVDRRSRHYFSIDTTDDPDEAVHYPVEFLNSLTPSGLPPHHLILKIGSPIMLLRNLDPPRLCNGTRLCVTSTHNNVIGATILAGPYKGQDALIPRIPLAPSNLFFNFKRLQFPVRLSYGMTINKSQGQSLKAVGINLTLPCFSHGQLYVACSRVGSPSNMFILTPNGETKNVVYRQALI